MMPQTIYILTIYNPDGVILYIDEYGNATRISSLISTWSSHELAEYHAQQWQLKQSKEGRHIEYNIMPSTIDQYKEKTDA
jgi:hypothetical protein